MAAFFQTETYIVNRALQKVGAQRIATGAFRTEQSKAADECRACYDGLRRAELRRNVWRFSIRTLAIRALNLVSQNVTFLAWAVGTTYKQNDVILGSDGQLYISLVGSNIGNDPTATNGFWVLYFGSLQANQYINTFSAAQIYAVNQYALGSNGTVYVSLVGNNLGNDPTVAPAVWSSLTTYASGNFVTGSDGNVYQSVAGTNLNHNPVGDGGVHWTLLVANTDGALGWDVATNVNANNSYFAGEMVYTLGSSTVYLSLVSGNQTNPLTDTTGSWLTFTSTPTLSAINFIYPVGSGPDTENFSRNVYMFPSGYLREAPQDPKASVGAFLGGPTGLLYDDWNFENQCFTSFDPGPVLFRFAADISDPTQFDPLFAEGFACRLGMEVCEPLTQSVEKINTIGAEYKKFMSEARVVNGIETGPTDPPLDDYIAVRV